MGEAFLFPYEALREALLNAVVHKDYASGIPIQISVYDDMIVFWNAGTLPENWTLERLLGKHPSRPFNPLLANAFFRAGYIEAWGRGIEKIAHECREHGIAPPVYDFGMAGLMLTFRANREQVQATTEAIEGRIAQESAQEKIVALLKTAPGMTRRQLAKQIGITEDSVKHHLDRLRSAGVLRHVGPTKAGRWEVMK